MRWTSIAVAGLLCGTAVASRAADMPLTVEKLNWNTVVAEDGSAVQDISEEMRVGTDASARRMAQQTSMPFSDGVDRIELVEAYTEKPDGTRIPIRPEGVRVQAAPGIPSMPAYSDRKIITAVLPEVAGGDGLFVHWRRTIAQPLFAGQFEQVNFFLKTIAWNSVDVRISTPADRPLQTEAQGGALAASEEGGRHVCAWHFTAPAVYSDPAALAPVTRVPRLLATTMPDWPTLSRGFAAQFAAKTIVTPAIQALADRVTAGTDDRRAQAALLYRWVGQHTRWVAIYLGAGNWLPHPAQEVLDDGYGDCKDQVTLLISLLHAKGIAAEPVLINLGPVYALSGPAIYGTSFNHSITYLPEWQLYADTTSGSAPFGTLPLNEYGKPILHATAEGAAPARMPTLAPGASSETLVTTASLDADGVVSGTSTTSTTGAFDVAAEIIRQAIDANGAEHYAEQVMTRSGHSGTGSFAGVGARAGAGSGEAAAREQVSGTFSQTAEPGWLEGDTFAMPTGLRPLLRVGDGPIGPIAPRNLPATEATPCYAATEREELSMALPEGYEPVRLPKDVTLAGSFFRYESRWSFAARTVAVTRSLVSTIERPLCTDATRVEAAKALAAIRTDLAAQIGLKRAE